MSFDHLEAAIWHRWTIIKNWSDRSSLTAWPTEAATWMKLFPIINRKDCIFK